MKKIEVYSFANDCHSSIWRGTISITKLGR